MGQINTGQAVRTYTKTSENLFKVTTKTGEIYHAKHLIFCKGPWAIEDGKRIQAEHNDTRPYPYIVQKLDLFFYKATSVDNNQSLRCPPMLMRCEMSLIDLQDLAIRDTLVIPNDILSIAQKNGKIEVPMYAMMEDGLLKVGYRINYARERVDIQIPNRESHPIRQHIVHHLLNTLTQNTDLQFHSHVTGLVTVRETTYINDPTVPEVGLYRDRQGAIHMLADGGISAKLALGIGEILVLASQGEKIPEFLDVSRFLNPLRPN